MAFILIQRGKQRILGGSEVLSAFKGQPWQVMINLYLAQVEKRKMRELDLMFRLLCLFAAILRSKSASLESDWQGDHAHSDAEKNAVE